MKSFIESLFIRKPKTSRTKWGLIPSDIVELNNGKVGLVTSLCGNASYIRVNETIVFSKEIKRRIPDNELGFAFTKYGLGGVLLTMKNNSKVSCEVVETNCGKISPISHENKSKVLKKSEASRNLNLL